MCQLVAQEALLYYGLLPFASLRRYRVGGGAISLPIF